MLSPQFVISAQVEHPTSHLGGNKHRIPVLFQDGLIKSKSTSYLWSTDSPHIGSKHLSNCQQVRIVLLAEHTIILFGRRLQKTLIHVGRLSGVIYMRICMCLCISTYVRTYITQHNTTRNYTALHKSHVTLNCIELHYIGLNCIPLYCIGF